MGWLEAHITQIWFVIIGFFVLYYVIADGLDLGVGMIALFTRDENKRGILMKSIQSIWQDNQTWLVVLGGMLFGAFPLFYSIVLSAFYVPIIIMFFGLIFRGIAFEFRDHAKNPSIWSLSFCIGSLIISVCQGLTLGGIFYGIPMNRHTFAGTIWSWFHPYSTIFTLGVVAGYIMLGANYLIMKTSGQIQEQSRVHSFLASTVTFIISIVVYIRTIARHPYIAQKWQIMPDVAFVALFPLLALFAFGMYLWNLKKRSEYAPFIWNVIMFICSFIGISIGFYPYIIPNTVTIQDAAVSSPKTLIFMLGVIIIFLPLIITYTSYKNWIFRGKVGEIK